MRIFVYVHMWPPIHCAGSEVTVHAAMRELVKRGHEVVTVADQTPESYEYEGVKVLSIPRDQNHHARIREAAKDCDIIITHLDCTSLAMQLMLDLHKPLVHFVHNHAQLEYWRTPPHKAQLVVFNSQWVADRERWTPPYKTESVPWPGPSIVLHPIVEPENYRCERGDKIAFVNPTEGKGVETVYRLSEAMPDFEFLVVAGIYGEQVAPPNLGQEWVARHPNIEFMDNSPDFRDVLRKTRVLLMPSNYESYGRCAVEACCAGIPVVVHPTEGLWEALGDGRPYPEIHPELKYRIDMLAFLGGVINGAGIFCDRDDILSWKSQIERLYSDDVYYRSRSDAALALAETLNPQAGFDRLEAALIQTLDDWQQANEVKTVKMWTSDRRLWETSEGTLVPEVNGRIPSNAIRLAVGIGGTLPESVAIQNGLIEGKMIAEPAENKAETMPKSKKSKAA